MRSNRCGAPDLESSTGRWSSSFFSSFRVFYWSFCRPFGLLWRRCFCGELPFAFRKGNPEKPVLGSVADVRCTATRSREEELGTTSWASWDTDTQLTATWPVGILKTDDMDVKLGNSGICEFSNHHSATKMVSTYPVNVSIIMTYTQVSHSLHPFPAWLAHWPFLSGLGTMPLVQVQSIPVRKLIQREALRGPTVLRSTMLPTSLRSPRSPMPIPKPQLGRDVEEFAWERCKYISTWNTVEEIYMTRKIFARKNILRNKI